MAITLWYRTLVFTLSLMLVKADLPLDVRALEEEVGDVIPDLETLSKKIDFLTRQVMLQQLFVEERIRSDGQSGIKQVRQNRMGTKPYHAETHSGKSVCAIHNHANNIRTIGMGEFIGVLNGVEFRTRHNDYRLKMPSTKETKYHETEDIAFPDVPAEVTGKPTIALQIQEMREWFKAWATQNKTHRPYSKYFKPILSYVEGAWQTSEENITEPFFSDRHHIDADTWHELQEKIRFTSYTGKKSGLENFAYLPTTIMSAEEAKPIRMAQWSYRIMCHPLKDDLPTNRLHLIDDIATRMAYKQTMDDYAQSRAARFRLNPTNSGTFNEGMYRVQLLDELMEQIPGKDNYPGDLKDRAFGEEVYKLYDGKNQPKNDPEMNTAYYHRWYRVKEAGAMGLTSRHRGFADTPIFMAMTSSPKVAGMKIEQCEKSKSKSKSKKQCTEVEQKWTYAFPLEIIYMTPLLSWNPYNLVYHNTGDAATANGRDGSKTNSKKAYDGTSSKIYFRTPDEFFSGNEKDPDAADTSKEAVGVLDPSGKIRVTRASGTRIFLPDIPGVGTLRTRYPIMPVHGEGSSVWKELDALQDVVMQSQTYKHMLTEKLAGESSGGTGGSGSGTGDKSCSLIELSTSMSQSTLTSAHKHTVQVTGKELEILRDGKTVTKVTSFENAHEHTLVIELDKDNDGKEFFKYKTCDGKKRCWDGHSEDLDISLTDVNCFNPETGNSDTLTVEMSLSGHGDHRHTLQLTKEQETELLKGKEVKVKSSTNAGHQHEVTVRQRDKTNQRANRYQLVKCDSFKRRCGDWHLSILFVLKPYINKDAAKCEEGELLVETTPSIEGTHRHWFCIDESQQQDLLDGKSITVATTRNSDHDHKLEGVRLHIKDRDGNIKMVKYKKCDGRKFCSDGHSSIMWVNRVKK